MSKLQAITEGCFPQPLDLPDAEVLFYPAFFAAPEADRHVSGDCCAGQVNRPGGRPGVFPPGEPAPGRRSLHIYIGARADFAVHVRNVALSDAWRTN